jgi:hypothetical protein
VEKRVSEAKVRDRAIRSAFPAARRPLGDKQSINQLHPFASRTKQHLSSAKPSRAQSLTATRECSTINSTTHSANTARSSSCIGFLCSAAHHLPDHADRPGTPR